MGERASLPKAPRSLDFNRPKRGEHLIAAIIDSRLIRFRHHGSSADRSNERPVTALARGGVRFGAGRPAICARV
jgi:hypothetical protein